MFSVLRRMDGGDVRSVCVCVDRTDVVTQVFKQEEFEGMFIEQVEKLKAGGEKARDGS
jgi:hypothetical protein